MHRRHFITAASAAALHVATWAQSTLSNASAAWPNKPLRWIVPFAPGGTTDFVTRLVALELSKSLGQPVVVDNKPGAGTVIGVDMAAKAAGDGYTLVTVANSFCVNHTLVKKLPYDTLKDLSPVALMGMSEHVLATHPNSGIKTIADIALWTSRKGGVGPTTVAPLSYASFGQGTSAHLAGEMLKTLTGADLVHIPYKGQAPALADLLGGQVSLMFGNWPEFRGHIASGKLVALGMATAKRSVYAPHIATLAEQGVALESNSWNGLLLPSATPVAIQQRLNAEVNKALASPAVLEAFQKGGIASLSGSPAQFGEFIQTEVARYAQVIRKANISAEA
jgi:tripartite-type tricarboxylate transporter receptor subunit TctC